MLPRRTELKNKTELKRGNSVLVRTEMKRGTVQLSRGNGIQRVAKPRSEAPDTEPAKPKKRKASRGLKGRPPTAAERAFMDRAGAEPCMACAKDGRHNNWISLHHCDGRTKPGAHFKVLPLCAPHHQPDDTDPLGRPSVHEHPEEFTRRYGTEAELLAELYARLAFVPPQQ